MKRIDNIIKVNSVLALLITANIVFSDWYNSTLLGHFSKTAVDIIWLPSIPHMLCWLAVALLGLACYRFSLILTAGNFAFMPVSYFSTIYGNLVVNFNKMFKLYYLDATVLSIFLLAALIISLAGLGVWFNAGVVANRKNSHEPK